MEDFDAKQARAIVYSLEKDEFNEVLKEIKSAAESGQTIIYLYESINNSTIQKLIDRGFKVESQGSMAIQRDGIYYSITW